MLTALTNGTFFTGKEIIKDKALLLEDGTVKGWVDPVSISTEARVINHEGHYIVPGLLDLQIYGGGGHLFSDDPSFAALTAMATGLVRTGTTGFLITLATNSITLFEKAIDVVRDNPHPAVLGLHLEGPYINPVKKGAHIEQYIKRPERKEVEALLRRAKGVIRMITLAPEKCDPEIIQLLLDNGVIVSAGHSNATYEEGTAGYMRGIQTTTHLFNAMSPFHHRDTGLPGAVYQAHTAYASIIPDGIHVSYPALSVSKKVMGDRLFLITDAVEASTGAYPHVRQKDRFTLPDGTLSGSAITLLQGIHNCVQYAGIPLDEAVRMASTYPARLFGTPQRGEITIGQKADLTIFNEAFEPQHVYISGVVYA